MSPEAKWPWSVLGLDKMPSDAKDIRRAYARALKQIDQATDIKGFSNLRAAYEYAVALHEGRTIRADLTRSRKAEAKAAEDAAAKATTEEMAGADARTTAPHPAPPPPSPEALATAARSLAFENLLNFLSAENIVMSGGVRINQVLDNPLSQDPAYANAIRHGIAEVIRTRFSQSEGVGLLSAQIDKETLLRLDNAYGWLSDFGAFRCDFWNNYNLLDAMATRAYGSIRAPKPPPARPKTRAGRAWLWAKDHATLLTVCYIGFILAASAVTGDSPVGIAVYNLLMWMILVPIILAMSAVPFIVCRGIFFFVRGLWRTLRNATRTLRLRLTLRFNRKT